MNSLIETLNAWGEHAFRFAWPMLWQSSLLIATLFALDISLRRKVRAAVRYSLWLVVLVKLLVPPSLALPTGLAWWLRHSAPPLPNTQRASFAVTYGPAVNPASGTHTLPAFVPPPTPPISPVGRILVTSSAISLGLFGWMLLRWGRVARDVREATEPPKWLEQLLMATRRQAGIHRSVRLRVTDRPMSPAVCGLFRPVILLPRTITAQLPPHQLRAVLLHELFHLKRCDVAVNFAQALLTIAYFWHPFLWLASARIRRVREEAVDDAVMLALHDDAETYAPTLLEVAKLAFDRPMASLGLVGILESRNALRYRIERLLNFRAPDRAGLSLLSVLGVLTFTALAVPMGEAPSKPSQLAAQAQPGEAHWPDPRFQGYQKIDLEAEFMIVDEAALRSIHPSLVDSRQPLVVTSNEVAELSVQLKRANARQFCETDPLRFPKFSGGHFRWQLGGVTNNLVDWQTGSEDDRIVIGANVEFIAAQTDWTPLEFTLVPWDEGDSVRCQIELAAQENTNASQQTEVTIPLGGALVWATSDRIASGRCQLVLLRQQETDPDSSLPAAQSSSTNLGATNDPAWPLESRRPESEVQHDSVTGVANSSAVGAASRLQDAKLLFETGKLDQAETNLKQAIKEDPGNQAAYYYLDRIRTARLKEQLRTPDSEGGIHPIPLAPLAQSNLAVPKPYPHNNLIHTSKGRQDILHKLESIRLDMVSFDSLPLGEVIHNLSDEARKRDPERKGINFVINADVGAARPQRPAPLDPTTGLPTVMPPIEANDINAVTVKISPALTDLRLVDALDAIVKVASRPLKYSIEDYAVVFSLRQGKEPLPLYVRIIKVDPDVFRQGLESILSLPLGNASRSTGESVGPKGDAVQAAVRQFFSSTGVDLTPPKSIFFNDREGTLVVRASLEDLDTIETAVQVLNIAPPQVNIKIKYIELPETEAKALLEQFVRTNGPSSGNPLLILRESDATSQLKKWQSIPQVDLVNEASITTLSGRQAQIRWDGYPFETFTNSLPVGSSAPPVVGKSSEGLSQTNQVRGSGPILDVIADVAADNRTLHLTITNTFTEFLGYDDPGSRIELQAALADIPNPSRTDPLPRFRLQQVHENAIVGDGQTLVLGLEQKPAGGPPRKESSAATKKHLIILITATVIDHAGNRYHSDEEKLYLRNK